MRIPGDTVTSLRAGVVLAGALALVPGLPAPLSAPLMARSSVEVTLDIFSGVPNPHWTLSPREISTLRRKLAAPLPAAHRKPARGLGYHGFLIFAPKGVGGLPRRITIFCHVLAITNRGTTRYYRDARHVERFLVRQARARGYGALIARAQARMPGCRIS